ncbi:MAG TPA: stage V sporulation protein D [Bacillota bacterium]|nr:stage V sporulation protein D [Bacillota bacterium]
MYQVANVTIKKRIFLVFIISLTVFLLIILRLVYVQLILNKQLTFKATDSWLRDIPFTADRGLILDRQGEVLVDNLSAPSVIVVPRQIIDAEQTAQHLANILQMPYDKALKDVTKQAKSVSIHPEGRKLTDEQAEKLRKLNLPGVYLAKDSKRYYPHDNYLSHVLGFTGIDNQGLMGLELYYDEQLKGEQGSLSYFSDARQRRIDRLADIYEQPIDGLNLETTIDLNVQTIIERELDLAVTKYNPDGALAIAVNPKTGGILGMTSRPNFSPLNYQEYASEVFDRNLPIWSTFEPGSTFKIITLAAALEEEVIDLTKDHYIDKGSIAVGGAKLRCWKSGGHGKQTYLEVVENSCNPGFVNLGLTLGKEKLFTYIRDFGFGTKTGIDLQGEGSGILFNLENVGPVELGTTSFGQGVSVTPIQQVMAVTAAINGGYLYEPYIAQRWLDPDTDKSVEVKEPYVKKRVISEETSKEVRETLERVVANGTGRPAYVDGYRVGGKTGTAQKVGEDGRYMQNNYVLSFIGFAPADDPEIVVYVAIDNPKDTVQFGGVVAAPIVGTIIHDSLMALDVPKRKTGLDKKYVWPENPPVEVPDVVGLTTEELTNLYTNLTIEAFGEGDYIVDQEPKPKSKVESGSTLRIYLSTKK